MATKTKNKKTVVSAKGGSSSGRKKPVVVTKAVVSKTKTNTPEKKAYKMTKPHALLLIVILVVAGLIYALRSYIVAATVNGQPITRLEVVKDAEKQAGKQALDSLVRNTLIEQEARKQKVIVTDKEIDDEIKKAEKSLSEQGRKMDDVLALQGLTRTDLRKLIRLDKMVTKMVGKGVVVTDKEVDEYISKNSDTLPVDQTPEQLKQTVKAQLTQQALGAKVQAWLADLQKKAKIQYFVQY